MPERAPQLLPHPHRSTPLTREAALVDEAFTAGFAIEPELTVSQWADAHRILSPRSSAAHGRWRTSRTPFLRDIMDALSAVPPARLNIPPGRRVVAFMKPTQIGGSEVGNNLTGYVIHHAPGPMLSVYSTLESARKSSDDRIGPMIEESEELRARTVTTVKAAGNSRLKKSGVGWSLAMVGSKAVSGLKSAPIRYLNGEEVDEWPGDIGGQGDTIALASRRLGTFGARAVEYYNSTCTIRGGSRIENLFKVSDQRRYFVPCPACKNLDFMRWKNIIWEEGHPETARLRCDACGELIEERWKTWMLRDQHDPDPDNVGLAEWRPTAEPGQWDRHTIGFHLNGLYTPLGWSPSWEEIARELLEANGERDYAVKHSKLKAWINTRLAETFEERGEGGTDADDILARAEAYQSEGEVPNGVGYLVASVDVQGGEAGRLEAVVKGYGASAESWLIAHRVLIGSPERPEVWRELDKWLLTPLLHESGQLVQIGICVIDSNYLSTQVYEFVKPRQQRRTCPVFAVRGGNERGKHLISNRSLHKDHKIMLHTLCPTTGKDTIAKRLQIEKPLIGAAPGYMHFPDWVTREYAEQLTAEQKLPVAKRGGGTVYEWKKVRDRNEALDLEVYALAAIEIHGGEALIRQLPERAAAWAKNVEGSRAEAPGTQPPPPAQQRPKVPRMPSRGWIGKHRPGR